MVFWTCENLLKSPQKLHVFVKFVVFLLVVLVVSAETEIQALNSIIHILNSPPFPWEIIPAAYLLPQPQANKKKRLPPR